MEVGFPFRIGDLFDYPYRECWPVVEAILKQIGPDWLLWGMDMPFQNRFCTYRQSRDYIERLTSRLIPRRKLGLPVHFSSYLPGLGSLVFDQAEIRFSQFTPSVENASQITRWAVWVSFSPSTITSPLSLRSPDRNAPAE
ncbi:MAG: hypothetical protein EXS33_00030 [Pedosphaera sp.]|nr:hypothetical protein [Pedosphaera sp.]